jgi:hypothetical protein
MATSIETFVVDAVDRLRARADALGGPADVTETFTDADDYPAFDSDGDANYNRGLVEGVAAAMNVTVLELLDELEIS